MKKVLIIGITLIIITIGLVIYLEIDKPINIYNITSKGLKEENKKVFLDTTFVAGTITDNYYVMFGDGVQYIVYIDEKEAVKINKYLLDNPDNSYRIEGITKLIPSDFEINGKKFVKEWLDHSHNHNEEEENHSHDITTNQFYEYFGYVYLDTNINNNLLKIIIYITGITGILFTLYYINTKYHFV